MRDISLEELLEAGCHFGHQVTRQNPKAREFVFEARDGIHIIDLAKTKEYLDEALSFVKEVAQRPNASLLIVGTKRQAQEIVGVEVKRAAEAMSEGENLFTVTNHWVGGTLTNFLAVQKNFQRLHELTKLLGSEEGKEKYTKKELVLFERERAKLDSFYSGIATMKELPSLLFVIDTHTENLAVREANRMGIPVVGMVDTNADPDVVSNPIPANDDAVGSIQLVTAAVLDAWVEGKTGKVASNVVKKVAKKEATGEGKKAEEAADTSVEEGEKSPVKTTKRSKKAKEGK